jgi:tRNA (adenine37-N6)-methyltransferase
MKILFQPIGFIHTPHVTQKGTPIQPFAAPEAVGRIEIFPDFRAALTDLKGFERIWLLFWCHQSKEFTPKVTPYQDVAERGLFATRAPSRPNPIGLSSVKLLEVDVDSGELVVQEVDMLDGTPLLDIKPYIPKYDSYPNTRIGWLEKPGVSRSLADDRFSRNNPK